jgi:hypothetical protein
LLDEAHTIKNPRTTVNAAVLELRAHLDICVMMTGTPLDNTWLDSFALLSLLKGRIITSEGIMRRAFTAPSSSTSRPSKKESRPVPRGNYLLRIAQLLSAASLRRPASTIQCNLQPRQVKICSFLLPKADLDMSNAKLADFKMALRRSKGKGKGKGNGKRKRRAKDQAGTDTMDADAWAALIEAQQHAYHPKLVDIMQVERTMRIQVITGEDVSDEPLRGVAAPIKAKDLTTLHVIHGKYGHFDNVEKVDTFIYDDDGIPMVGVAVVVRIYG